MAESGDPSRALKPRVKQQTKLLEASYPTISFVQIHFMNVAFDFTLPYLTDLNYSY